MERGVPIFALSNVLMPVDLERPQNMNIQTNEEMSSRASMQQQRDPSFPSDGDQPREQRAPRDSVPHLNRNERSQRGHSQARPEVLQEGSGKNCRLSILVRAIIGQGLLLASFVPWVIAIVMMLQLHETFMVVLLAISMASCFGYFVAKVVIFIRSYQLNQEDEEAMITELPSNEPPPYEIAVAKPPPYHQLFSVSASCSGTSTSSAGLAEYPSLPLPCRCALSVAKVHSSARKKEEGEARQPEKQSRSATREESDPPSYEQAMIMISRGSDPT